MMAKHPKVRVGYTNLAQRTDWPKRRPLVLTLFRRTVRASLYLLAETDYDMAADLATGLGWGSKGRPCWRTDENRNTVLWDPSKWRDIDTIATSLSVKAGDLGDRHYRSAVWVQLEHTTGDRAWFGAAHLSNGTASADRHTQANVIAHTQPATGLPRLLGIDRNSLETSAPALALEVGGLPLLTPNLGSTFLASPSSGAIDGLHGTVALRNVTKLIRPGVTDHAVLRAGVTL